MSMLSTAIRIASVAFEGKTDKGGNAYILHCLHVMNEVNHLGEDAMCGAVLHDLLEDTDWTVARMYKEEFSDNVVSLVVALTHRSNEDYMSYIRRVAMHPIAKEIKKADLRHNSDITRMKGLSQKDFDRLQKYFTAYAYLNG